jgi:hypothetical protein
MSPHAGDPSRRHSFALGLIGAWDGAWKTVAVIRAGRRRQWGWVAALATVNSVGLLPILYLFVFSRRAG